MAARVLDGNKIREEIIADLAVEIRELKAAGITPGLAAILVGDNPASHIYVRNKVKACQSLGLYSEKIELPSEASTEDLIKRVGELNRRDSVDGILIQLPLPPQVDTQAVLEAVDPAKDVDGLHPVNLGYLVSGRPGLVPCTPAGIVEILRRGGIAMAGSQTLIIGRSNLVGKPLALLLLREHATVTIAHSRTRALAPLARQADILIAAIGQPGLVTAEFIKPHATVIDVGINRLTTPEEIRRLYRQSSVPLHQLEAKGSVLVGDVQPEDASEMAGAFTPVPGGVGPLTIAMLMVNSVRAAKRRRMDQKKTTTGSR
jgi:methylenetetrahydrofolate dehydrogenase (NADP+)/methenyltetrahydrofolate cyclohydrolase